MRNNLFGCALSALVLGTALSCAAPPAFAQAVERPPQPGSPAAIPLMKKEIVPGVFLITGRGGNAIVVRTADGPLLIDNKVMRESVRDELNQILQGIDPRPVKMAFITHHHADHGGGTGWLLDAGVPVVGHANLPEILRRYRSTIAPRNPSPPSITFDTTYRVTVGGVPVEAYYWGPAHTNADIVIRLPQSKVVVVGDLVVGDGEPDVDALDGHGSLLGLQQRLADLLRLDFVLAIPGHGENAMTRDEVALYKRKIDTLIARGQAAIRAGVAPENLIAAMHSEDLAFRLVGHFWTEPARLKLLYDELAASTRTGRDRRRRT